MALVLFTKERERGKSTSEFFSVILVILHYGRGTCFLCVTLFSLAYMDRDRDTDTGTETLIGAMLSPALLRAFHQGTPGLDMRISLGYQPRVW
jgi:hypothetical protein